jgi:nucleotide-binding universal stress UspA family protein
MLHPLGDLPATLDGLEAVGSVERDELSRALALIVERAQRERRRIRLVYVLGPSVELGAVPMAWDDLRIALRMAGGLFDGCAIVSDDEWVREATKLVANDLRCPVRVFATSERALAIAWLLGLPAHAAP